jgi:2-methylfumaryl-CoA hydratase
MSKTATGSFFEDFAAGTELIHATPRTVTAGDAALYISLTGARFAAHSSEPFAQNLGFATAPVDDLLVFHLVFGKSVPDVSLNAVANLGYAGLRFGATVYAGDTLSARSLVVGVKENSNARTGVVYVRTSGVNQRAETVLEFYRWVMVPKRDPGADAPDPVVPDLPEAVAPDALIVPDGLHFETYDTALAGSPHLWDDFEAGEKIDHVDGITIEDAEHMMAAKLYQNTARVHFNQHVEAQGRFARRIVYGGHIISLARALSFNGLANAFHIAAINAGRHVAPSFAGDTIYAWSEVIEKAEIAERNDVGAIRLRLVAAKDHACSDFPDRIDPKSYHEAVVLDLDYWALMPRRA